MIQLCPEILPDTWRSQVIDLLQPAGGQLLLIVAFHPGKVGENLP
jgi:hypothetical protein